MLFCLKNAGATYQMLVNHMFRPQIGRNVEVYMDDMLVKSLDEEKHLDDLEGIEANPDKIQTILNIEPSKNVKEV